MQTLRRPLNPTGGAERIPLGQDGQVRVVGHEAEAQHGHRDFNAGMGQGLENGWIVSLFPEHPSPASASIANVVIDPSHRSWRGAWHRRRAGTAVDRMSIVNLPVPFCSLLLFLLLLPTTGKQAGTARITVDSRF